MSLFVLTDFPTQVLLLQNLLIWSRTKQIVLLDQINSTSPVLQIESLQGKIDKRHHPILVLRDSLEEQNVKQVVICRGSKLQKVANHLISGKWVLEDNSHSMRLERKVLYSFDPINKWLK